MIGKQIENRLKQILSKYTTDFSEVKEVTLTSQNNIVTADYLNHSLNTDDYVVVSGAKRSVDIASIVKISNEVIVTTIQDHDIVDNLVEIVNTANFNGSYTIEVLDIKRIKFNKVGNFANENTGKLLLTDYNGFNGFKKITKIDNNKFTYQSDVAIYGNSNAYISIGSRIQHIGSSDRAVNFFQNNNLSQSKPWLFIILGDEKIENQGSAITTENISYQGQSYYYRSLLEFSLFVAIPTANSSFASAESDKARSYIMPILKSIGNYRFTSNLTQQKYQPCVYNGNATDEYNVAYYVHRFDFLVAGEVQSNDTIDELAYAVPLKEINLLTDLQTNVKY
jgi:hypothetical protein